MVVAVLVGLAFAASAALVVRAVLYALALRRLVVIVVDGESMAPSYHHGDRVCVKRRDGSRVRCGQVVVVEQPEVGDGWSRLPPPDGTLAERYWYIKRVAAVPGDPVPAEVAAAVDATATGSVPDGSLVLLGDNTPSDDSRQWGYFPAERVYGVVVRRLNRRGHSNRAAPH